MMLQETERGKWTSASSAPADALCEGRYLAQNGLPEETSDAAEFGIRVHKALCKGSSEGLTPEETTSYDICSAKEKEALAKFFGPAHDPEKIETIRERRLWALLSEYPHSGQLDAAHRIGPRALIVDYKSLQGAVQESEANLQLRDQAVLYWSSSVLLDEIGTTIAQPGREVVICVYDQSTIKRSLLEMLNRVVASHNPKSRTAGPLQCAYCRAKKDCLEYAKWAASLIPVAASSDDFKAIISNWSPAQWAGFLDNKTAAEAYIKFAYEFAKGMVAVKPDFIPGYELVPGDRKMEITKTQEAFDRFAQLGGKLEDFMSCIKIKNGELSSAVGRATGKNGKELKDAMRVMLEGICEIKQNQPSLERKK